MLRRSCWGKVALRKPTPASGKFAAAISGGPGLERWRAGDGPFLSDDRGDLDRSLDRTAKEPVVSRESEYYLAHIGDVKSIDDFLGNDRLFKYAMKAFGLQDMDYAKAFIRKVLEEGDDYDDSFANKLSDKRYQDFATTFNFARYGDATTAFDRTQQGTVDNYVRQTLEQEAGDQNQGVRLALYFQRKAPDLKDADEIRPTQHCSRWCRRRSASLPRPR